MFFQPSNMKRLTKNEVNLTHKEGGLRFRVPGAKLANSPKPLSRGPETHCRKATEVLRSSQAKVTDLRFTWGYTVLRV